MKNSFILFVTFLLVGFNANASLNENNATTHYPNYYDEYGKSFTFVEQGVTFAIFQNGEFDFYINPRNGLHVNYRTNNVNISFNSGYNYDAYVQYDSYGAIIQIENIPIYYDYYGRVDRIGNISINYRYGRLSRLGGLHIYYDNYGYYSYYSGYINMFNRHYVYHPYHNFFSRPLFEFRVVSYKPYRSHYKPNRYTYHRDHSRNKYYYKNNKRANYSTHNNSPRRIVTNNVPKRESTKTYGVVRNNTVTRAHSNSNRISRTNSEIRTNRRNTRAVTSRNEATTKRFPKRVTQQKRTINRKLDRVKESRTVSTRKNESRNKTISRTRKPIKRVQKKHSEDKREKRS